MSKMTTFMTPEVITFNHGKPWKYQRDINTIDTDKDLTIGEWNIDTPLPEPLSGFQAIVVKNRVYLLGGYNGTNFSSKIYTAIINNDGTLGEWSISSNSLPKKMNRFQAIIVEDKIHLLSGWNGSDYLSTIYTTTINDDGALGEWIISGNLPLLLIDFQTVIINNKVYILSGRNLISIYAASINDDNILGKWNKVGVLPEILNSFQVVVIKDKLYLLGSRGINGGISRIYVGIINSDGKIGKWTISKRLPKAVYKSQAVVVNNKIYLIGGYNRSNDLISDVFIASINDDGTLGEWINGPSLPEVLSYSQAIVTNSRIYLLGGYDDTGLTSVVYFISHNNTSLI